MYQRIRDLREDRDLLQKDVAAYLKCTQVCYSNYETGMRDIPTEVLIQLAHLYHTSTDYIIRINRITISAGASGLLLSFCSAAVSCIMPQKASFSKTFCHKLPVFT